MLRCVSGIRSHDAGELRVAQRADVGYLEQTAVSGSKLTVAEEARSRMTHVKAAEDAVRAAEDAMEKQTWGRSIGGEFSAYAARKLAEFGGLGMGV